MSLAWCWYLNADKLLPSYLLPEIAKALALHTRLASFPCPQQPLESLLNGNSAQSFYPSMLIKYGIN